MEQCSICGHPKHKKFQCPVGTTLFTPKLDRERPYQRNCTCPEDTEKYYFMAIFTSNTMGD